MKLFLKPIFLLILITLVGFNARAFVEENKKQVLDLANFYYPINGKAYQEKRMAFATLYDLYIRFYGYNVDPKYSDPLKRFFDAENQRPFVAQFAVLFDVVTVVVKKHPEILSSTISYHEKDYQEVYDQYEFVRMLPFEKFVLLGKLFLTLRQDTTKKKLAQLTDFVKQEIERRHSLLGCSCTF